jgi:phage terminase small subunit
MAANKLTDKQQLFVLHYLECLNGTKAAKLAGYNGEDNALAVIAYENLRKPHIRAAIDAEIKARAMGADEVLTRLSDMARADMTEFLGLTEGEVKEHPHARLVKRFRRTTTVYYDRNGEPSREVENVEVELHDQQAALIQLGRYHKLFVDRQQVDDWRSQAIADIKAGRLAYEALVEAFDDDLATELFRAAGVAVQIGQGAQEQ